MRASRRNSGTWADLLKSLGETPVSRILLLAPVTAIAAGLRLYGLDREPVWFDEALTIMTARLPVPQLLDALRHEGNAPLYYVIVHAWIQAFGDTELAVRLLSALVGVISVVCVYAVGSAVVGPQAALLSAGLAAVSPIHIHYSQEARMYSMVALTGALVVGAVWRLAVSPTWGAVVLFALALSIGLYLHYWFLFVIPIATWALTSDRPREAIAKGVVAICLALVAFLPWLPTFLGQATNPAANWIAEIWRTRSIWLAIPWSLQILGPAAVYPEIATFKFLSGPAGGALSLGLGLVVAVVSLRRLREGTLRGCSSAFLLVATLTPLCVALIASVCTRPVYVPGRYDLVAWAAYHLLAGAALKPLGRRWSVAFVALWVTLAGCTLLPYFTSERIRSTFADSGKDLARYLSRHADPDDMIIFTAGTWMVASYYLRDRRPSAQWLSYPLEARDHAGWFDGRIRYDSAHQNAEARRVVHRLRHDRPLRLWIVAPESRGAPQLLRSLHENGYRVDYIHPTKLVLRMAVLQE